MSQRDDNRRREEKAKEKARAALNDALDGLGRAREAFKQRRKKKPCEQKPPFWIEKD